MPSCWTIVVPTNSHFEVGKLALEHGCDLLIEKPITPTTAEADELIRVAAEKGRIIQVGHIERFNGAVRACEPYLENHTAWRLSFVVASTSPSFST